MTPITLINPFNQKPLRLSDAGLTDDTGHLFPQKDGVHIMVKNQDYTGNFGYQWNRFQTTQLDNISGINLSKDRFFAETGWDPKALDGQQVLEVGSGAGRFTQVLLAQTNAEVYSVDYSEAVFANYRNNGPNKRLHLFQASVYELPFAPAQFDKVFCFGVLQHTPDVERTVASLISMVKPGGELVVDFYPIKGWWTKLHAKYIFRPFTKKMSHEKLLSLINKNADRLIGTYRFFDRIGIGRFVNRFLPVCDIKGTLPENLNKTQLREMVVLDTFDMFSPEYDQPQKIKTVVSWFKKHDMEHVWGGYINYDKYQAAVVKGTRKKI